MKITNEYNLPDAFVNFVSNVRHNNKGELSATTILKGAKEIVLTDRHFDEIEVDASEMVWSTFGTAFHSVMEKQTENNDVFKEERLAYSVDGLTVTGRLDRYDMATGTVEDWKTASVWKVIKGDFQDWEEQGLVYAWLLRKNNLPCNKIRFIALLKDHSKTESKRNADYPKKPVYTIEFKITDEKLKAIEEKIKAKIADVKKAQELADDDIVPCSEYERWATQTKYAVMKNGRKTALKLFDKIEDAEQMASSDNNYYVDKRKGESKKCLDYCPCADFCNFRKKLEEK